MEDKKEIIKLTKEELKEIFEQYRILWELLETVPKRKILTNFEKEWYLKRQDFFNKHKKIEKLFQK